MSKYIAADGLVVRNKPLRLFNYALLVFFVIIVVVPMLIVFLTSFKSNQEYMYSNIWDFPKNFLNFENYVIYVQKGKMFTGLRNVATMTVVALTATLFMGSMVSYVVSRFDFKGKKLVLGAYVFAAIIPTTTTAVATFTIIKALHVYNTIYAGCILYSATGVLDIYLFIQFISKISVELDQSARIDGASYFRVYWSIILPLLKPAIATVAILRVVFIYNDFFTPITYMPSLKLATITTGLMKFTQDRISQWNVMAAGIIAVLLPTLVVYLLAQKYIISGVTNGSVKM
jgi:raffinose/stachyose/melibiose transport system permease protein